MSRRLVVYVVGLATALSGMAACSSEGLTELEGRGGTSGAPAGSPDGSGTGGAGGSGAASGSAPTNGGTSNGGTSSGGTSSGVGGASAGAGGGAAGSGTAGTLGGGTDCATAPADECPLVSGIPIGCKRRFALGMNYAWRSFSADFGGLASWSIQGVSAAPQGYASDLAAMKSNGASVIRWWVFPDFRGDGVQFDAANDPTGLSPTALADVAKALELAAQADVYLVPTIFSFDAFRPTRTDEGVLVRGMTPLVTSPARRAKLIANIVRPLAKAAAASAHSSRLLGWDVINEPEWAIEPSGMSSQDFSPNEELDAVSLADMKALINESVAALEQETPKAFTSVGWAAAKWAWAFTDVAVDVNQPHIYGWVNEYWPYTRTPAELGYPAGKPTIMGEFYMLPMPFSDRNATATFATILESWWSNGYAGAWPWQHFDSAANMPLLKAFSDAKGCPAKP
jgi:hypothetical protein